MQLLARILMITFGLVLLGTPASAVVLSPGDIVALHGPVNDPELVRVDPSSGASALIANTSSCPGVASAGAGAARIAVEASGNLLFADPFDLAGDLYRIDPSDGTCTVVAGGGIGGTTFNFLLGIAVVPAAPLVGATAEDRRNKRAFGPGFRFR
ncbi:MAG: hypothetical protein HRU14_16055 [Planctomycetes bacterium]|nr:hypothetical protein [Planctomycetota bacterium]